MPYPFEIDLRPALAIAAVAGAGAGGGYASYVIAIAAGASALGASALAALVGSLGVIGTGLYLEFHYKCSEMGTGAAAPLLPVDEAEIASVSPRRASVVGAFAIVGAGLGPQHNKTGTEAKAAGPDLCP